MFVVNKLKKRIGERAILDQLSFSCKKGEIALFLGGSGVGKSTLLRVIAHLESYDSGEILCDGKPVDLTQVGMVFQQFNLFEHLNVIENITIALKCCQGMSKEEAQSIALSLLEKYGLTDHAQSPVSKLSGGQKQRVAIARALALNPQIICMDEPTSALDPRLTKQVAEVIQSLAAAGKIVLLTTHDTSLIEMLSGTLHLMEQGQIIESGESSAFQADSLRFPLLERFLLRVNS